MAMIRLLRFDSKLFIFSSWSITSLIYAQVAHLFSRLIASAPRSAHLPTWYKSPRVHWRSAQQTGSLSPTLERFSAANSHAQACRTSARHARKCGVARAVIVKQLFSHMLAGLTRLSLNKPIRGLAKPSLFPPPKPNPLSPTPLAVSLIGIGGKRGYGFALCALFSLWSGLCPRFASRASVPLSAVNCTVHPAFCWGFARSLVPFVCGSRSSTLSNYSLKTKGCKP